VGGGFVFENDTVRSELKAMFFFVFRAHTAKTFYISSRSFEISSHYLIEIIIVAAFARNWALFVHAPLSFLSTVFRFTLLSLTESEQL